MDLRFIIGADGCQLLQHDTTEENMHEISSTIVASNPTHTFHIVSNKFFEDFYSVFCPQVGDKFIAGASATTCLSESKNTGAI